MNLIEIEGKFYSAEGEPPRNLVGFLGENGTVAYNPEAQIAEFKLSVTADGDLAPAIEDAIASVKDALAKAGADGSDLFDMEIRSEELVAIGGNLHKRGRLIEAAAKDRREAALKT